VKHIRHREVTGIKSLPGDFAACIYAGERFANGVVKDHVFAFIVTGESHFGSSFPEKNVAKGDYHLIIYLL